MFLFILYIFPKLNFTYDIELVAKYYFNHNTFWQCLSLVIVRRTLRGSNHKIIDPKHNFCVLDLLLHKFPLSMPFDESPQKCIAHEKRDILTKAQCSLVGEEYFKEFNFEGTLFIV